MVKEPTLRVEILQDFNNLHVTQSVDEYVAKSNDFMTRWWNNPDTKAFCQYYWDEWLVGKFSNWQL